MVGRDVVESKTAKGLTIGEGNQCGTRNLQLYIFDASKTRLVYPIDPGRFMPNMEVVTGHSLDRPGGIRVTVSLSKSADIVSRNPT